MASKIDGRFVREGVADEELCVDVTWACGGWYLNVPGGVSKTSDCFLRGGVTSKPEDGSREDFSACKVLKVDIASLRSARDCVVIP